MLLDNLLKRLDSSIHRTIARTCLLSAKFKALVEELGATATPKWLEKEKDSFEGKVIAMPQRDDIDYEVAEHLIVELYSK